MAGAFRFVHARSAVRPADVVAMLLLLLTSISTLALLLSLGACSGLPHDIRQWNVEERRFAEWSVLGTHLPAGRIWGREDLHQAANVESFEQLRPLLNKLNRGQPITILCIGDSVAATLGGCFGEGCALSRKGPTGYNVGVGGVGWLFSFMSTINASWPHPEHRLINRAFGGQTFHRTTHNTCLEAIMPAVVSSVHSQFICVTSRARANATRRRSPTSSSSSICRTWRTS